jgi:hypothetical protein
LNRVLLATVTLCTWPVMPAAKTTSAAVDALGDARRARQDRSGKDRSVERLLIGDAGRADIAVGDRRPDGRQADRQDDGGEDHGTARLVSEEGGHRARHGAALGHGTKDGIAQSLLDLINSVCAFSRVAVQSLLTLSAPS